MTAPEAIVICSCLFVITLVALTFVQLTKPK